MVSKSLWLRRWHYAWHYAWYMCWLHESNIKWLQHSQDVSITSCHDEFRMIKTETSRCQTSLVRHLKCKLQICTVSRNVTQTVSVRNRKSIPAHSISPFALFAHSISPSHRLCFYFYLWRHPAARKGEESIKNTHFGHKFGVMEYELTVPESRESLNAIAGKPSERAISEPAPHPEARRKNFSLIVRRWQFSRSDALTFKVSSAALRFIIIVKGLIRR